MSNYVNSANMSLPVPIVGVEFGPQYALDINACMAILDQHDHTPGLGVAITPNGMNISIDLTMNAHNLTNVRSVRFTPQGSPLALVGDVGCLFESGVDLYYNDGSGNHVRITQGGGVAGSPGSITGLASPATASYSVGSLSFIFQSAANTSAILDAGSIIIRNATANSKGLTLAAPAAMGADYTLTLPALPGANNFMSLDASGNITALRNVDNSSIEIVSNVIRVKAAGIAAAMLASGAALSNIGLGGILSTYLAAPLGNTVTRTTNGNYTVPAGAYLLLVAICGGGGGGGGSGDGTNPGTNGTTGGDSTFGALVTGGGGAGGPGASAVGGAPAGLGFGNSYFGGAYGGGGAGAAGTGGGSGSIGGGSAPLIIQAVSVTPGQVIVVTLGAAGGGGTGANPGGAAGAGACRVTVIG